MLWYLPVQGVRALLLPDECDLDCPLHLLHGLVGHNRRNVFPSSTLLKDIILFKMCYLQKFSFVFQMLRQGILRRGSRSGWHNYGTHLPGSRHFRYMTQSSLFSSCWLQALQGYMTQSSLVSSCCKQALQVHDTVVISLKLPPAGTSGTWRSHCWSKVAASRHFRYMTQSSLVFKLLPAGT
jgi:hypothetical protein